MTAPLESENHRKVREAGIFAHSEFQRVYNEMFVGLRNLREGRCLVLVGPSRAGKTAVLRAIQKDLLSGIRPRHQDDVPILSVEADLSNDGRLRMKQFTAEALKRIGHPFFSELGTPEDFSASQRSRLNEGAMRLMLLHSMQIRGTLYFFIDEAHHLLMSVGGELYLGILDALKNLCNKCDAVLVLVGGYKLLDGLQSAHFSGRIDLVHFSAYSSSAADLRQLGSILRSLEGIFPVSEEGLLVRHVKEIREMFWGTVGAMIDGICSAESKRIARGAAAIEMQDIYSSRLPARAAKLLQDDIAYGREYLSGSWPNGADMPSGVSLDAAQGNRKPFKKKPCRRTPQKIVVA